MSVCIILEHIIFADFVMIRLFLCQRVLKKNPVAKLFLSDFR